MGGNYSGGALTGGLPRLTFLLFSFFSVSASIIHAFPNLSTSISWHSILTSAPDIPRIKAASSAVTASCRKSFRYESRYWYARCTSCAYVVSSVTGASGGGHSCLE